MRAADFRVETTPAPDQFSTTMLVCMRIAMRYVHRTPTPEELQAAYGMSRATAYRYVAAIREAKGETEAANG